MAAKLKNMRWKLLQRGSRVRGQARVRLQGLLASKLATGRAWQLKESFDHFWKYTTMWWGGAYLDGWIERAMRSPRLRKDTHRHDAASRILAELG